MLQQLKQEEYSCKIVKDLEMQLCNDGKQRRHAVFLCPTCNNNFTAIIYNFKLYNKKARSNQCSSCNLASHTTHKATNLQGFKQWESMMHRCYNQKDKYYHRYGGRDIKVHEDWKNNPKNYLEYIKNLDNSFKKDYTLDRIDNNKDYEPSNLRWVDKYTQSANSTLGVHGKSKYKGVTWNKMCNKWMVRIMIKGKRKLLGYYDDEIEAAKSYDNYCKSINFKEKLLNEDIYKELKDEHINN